MSIEILDCLKRKRDICIKSLIPSWNTAFRGTPALTKISETFDLKLNGIDSVQPKRFEKAGPPFEVESGLSRFYQCYRNGPFNLTSLFGTFYVRQWRKPLITEAFQRICVHVTRTFMSIYFRYIAKPKCVFWLWKTVYSPREFSNVPFVIIWERSSQNNL